MGRERDRHSEQPVRITTAATSRADDIAARQKRYVISMAIRSACFIGAAISGAAGITWLWPFLIVAALVLPYVAVVMANNSTSKSDGFELVDRGYDRQQLDSAPDSPRHTGQDHI